ncbi:hypothetical protein BD414DRAFT_120430 [Trametes punicea]|nr:hypothetical protein BD414DRAFT_120430 [Trametes punicea]
MHTTLRFTQDRRAVADLSAVGSGVGGGPRSRVPSSPMGPKQTNGVWKQQPTPIQIPARTGGTSRSAALNPFNNGRMKSTLDGTRRPGLSLGDSGNHTARRTVLDGSVVNRNHSYAIPNGNPAKRQKLEPASTSRYFRETGAGQNDSKGKTPIQADAGMKHPEPEIIPDSQEDRSSGPPKGKGREKASTPDPLDCIGSEDHEPMTSSRRPGGSPPHDFDIPSDDERRRRLPTDGPSTIRLRKQLARRTEAVEVVNVDASSDHDEIESASGFDRDDVRRRNVATPNGRRDIPPGSVREKIGIFEQKDARPSPKPPQQAPLRTIDLRLEQQQQSRKGGMKPRNAKTQTTTNLEFSLRPLSDTLDPTATAPSGFKMITRNEKLQTPTPLPLKAISLGCHIIEGDEFPPSLWVSVQPVSGRGYKLIIAQSPQATKGIAEFATDQDFDSMKYTDVGSASSSDAVVIIQLQSTKSARFRNKAFEPGSSRPTGWITLRFLVRHANWNGDGYSQLVNILKNQISRSELMRYTTFLPHSMHAALSFEDRAPAPEGCWETVEVAAKHKAGEFDRNTPRQTRSNGSAAESASMAGPSSVSAGPSNVSSTTVVPKEPNSSSAPPTRTYGTERRVTRQSARTARTSATPENLDELVLVYPPSGTGAVNITRGDLKRLDDGQYLNDTLIEFGLKLWLDTVRKDQPELAEEVHVFNSFFFKKLNSKRDVQDSYPSVRKWTSKVDIFKKRYIIVPINENFHWYLAIIVNPADILHPPPPQTRVAPQTRKRRHDEKQRGTSPEVVAEDGISESRSDTASEPVPDVMIVDADSEGDQEVETMLRFSQSCNIADSNARPQLSEGKASSRSRSGTREVITLDDAELQYPTFVELMDIDSVPGPEKESKPPDAAAETSPEPSSVDQPITAEEADAATGLSEATVEHKGETGSPGDEGLDQTSGAAEESSEYPNACIYTFDSLGSRHPGAVNKLGHYLRHEAGDKKGHPLEKTQLATSKRVKGPMQKNSCDCGLFVLAFVEAFMKDPGRSIERIQNNQDDWYTGSMANLRQEFREKTLALSEAWKKERVIREGAKEESINEKANAPEPEVIEDSDDEIIVGEIIPASKTPNKGGKKRATGKAARLR